MVKPILGRLAPPQRQIAPPTPLKGPLPPKGCARSTGATRVPLACRGAVGAAHELDAHEGSVMRAMHSVDVPCGYVVTAEGREAAEEIQSCKCTQLFITDGCLACPHCGTVSAVVYGWMLNVRASRKAHHRL